MQDYNDVLLTCSICFIKSVLRKRSVAGGEAFLVLFSESARQKSALNLVKFDQQILQSCHAHLCCGALASCFLYVSEERLTAVRRQTATCSQSMTDIRIWMVIKSTDTSLLFLTMEGVVNRLTDYQRIDLLHCRRRWYFPLPQRLRTRRFASLARRPFYMLRIWSLYDESASDWRIFPC